MTALDIIKQVFNDRGFSDFLDGRRVTPPTLEYCVQYRETDFNFVCRLMEEYGIYYYFVHSDGQHMLVLADAKTSHESDLRTRRVDFIPTDDGGRREAQYPRDAGRSAGARKAANFTSTTTITTSRPTICSPSSQKPGGYAHNSMEISTIPATTMCRATAATLAKVKVEAAQSLDKRRSAKRRAPSLFPGALVTLAEYPFDAENQEYLVTHCSHSVDAQTYRSGDAPGAPAYSGHYEMMPSDRQFRAPLVTRKPEIAGVQSALVVAERQGSGEEIDVDELGRVLVQFYWDRKKEMTLRAGFGSPSSGPAADRGALFLPRIGDEVLVALRGGRPRSPARCRLGLQRDQHGSDELARQNDEFRHSDADPARAAAATTCCCSTIPRAARW